MDWTLPVAAAVLLAAVPAPVNLLQGVVGIYAYLVLCWRGQRGPRAG